MVKTPEGAGPLLAVYTTDRLGRRCRGSYYPRVAPEHKPQVDPDPQDMGCPGTHLRLCVLKVPKLCVERGFCEHPLYILLTGVKNTYFNFNYYLLLLILLNFWKNLIEFTNFFIFTKIWAIRLYPNLKT